MKLPECAHFRDPVGVPGPSAERAVPTAGCIRQGPSARRALTGNVGRGCDYKKPVVEQRFDIHKINVGVWQPRDPDTHSRYKQSGLEWFPSVVEQDQARLDMVSEVAERQRNRRGPARPSFKVLPPEKARKYAEKLARWCSARALAPEASVADADMEALLDSGATDHTVGINALSSQQLKLKYEIPAQTYNMATGKVEVDEAVDLYVPALGVVLPLAAWAVAALNLRGPSRQGERVWVSMGAFRRHRRCHRPSRAGGRHVVS